MPNISATTTRGTNSPGPVTAAQYPALRAFCLAHAAQLRPRLQAGVTQTNDVLRSALLFPAFCLVAARAGGRPLGLVEIGTSGGLNLCWDQYRYEYGGAVGAKKRFDSFDDFREIIQQMTSIQ